MFRFIIFILLAMPFVALAADAKYPPYPEIWGYEFKGYIDTPISPRVGKYQVEQDNYWFVIGQTDPSDDEMKTTLVKFFEGISKDSITEEEERKLYDNTFREKVPLDKEKEVTFADGTRIILQNVEGRYKKCPNEFVYTAFLEKRDSTGALLGRHSVIHILPKPFEFIEGYCHDECGTTTKGKIYIQATSLDNGIVALADDTVLVYDWNGNILRLDKDLETKYDSKVEYTTRDGQTIRTSFAIIPTDVIENMRNEILKNEELPFRETLQNRLLDYISKNYN